MLYRGVLQLQAASKPHLVYYLISMWIQTHVYKTNSARCRQWGRGHVELQRAESKEANKTSLKFISAPNPMREMAVKSANLFMEVRNADLITFEVGFFFNSPTKNKHGRKLYQRYIYIYIKNAYILICANNINDDNASMSIFLILESGCLKKCPG